VIKADSDGKCRITNTVIDRSYHFGFAREFLEKAPCRFISLSNAELKRIMEGYASE
jgi:hypothetical protein